MLVDLTAAYDTVWHHSLTCKMLRLLPDRHIVHMIIEMVGNRSLPLPPEMTKGADYDASSTAFHRDLCWRPSLQHLAYISDLPTTFSRKYAYAYDAAIMHANGDWQVVEGVLTKDMSTVGKYRQSWKLKLSTKNGVGTLPP